MKRDFLLIGLLLLAAPLFAQYYGGNDDGLSVVGTGPGYFCTPERYCSGGTGDGQAGLLRELQPFWLQDFYCSSGPGDGFDLKSFADYLFDPSFCYGGGAQDGAGIIVRAAAGFFDQDFYLSGGQGDGFTGLVLDAEYLNNQVIYSSGGTGDGFSPLASAATYVGNTALYATGGDGDGFAGIACAGPVVYSPAWRGGAQDGASALDLGPYTFSNPLFCLGGTGDGFGNTELEATYFGPGAWLGTISTAWENPLNWSGNQVPGTATDVFLLSGKRYYPVISSGKLSVNHVGVHQCKSLRIGEGASVTNLSGLDIYGVMSVSGMYYGDGPNSQVVVFPGGNLVLSAPGQMLTGKP